MSSEAGRTSSIDYAPNEYEELSVDAGKQTGINKEKAESKVGNVIESLPGALRGVNQTVREDLATSALVISILGYIVIAAFGQIDSIRYFGYIFFLVFSFALYKFAAKTISITVSKPNKYLAVALAFFIVLIAVIYQAYIADFVSYLYRIIFKTR
ncbi:MAG TPA: hypothetical protein VLG37_00425 [Candidatus Saccharimonadales bacterium]|nr:hypothetical protein [Candidatus Saccharimonadales bacterium]